MDKLSHLNEQGRAKMINVEDKASTARVAIASGKITMAAETLERIKNGGLQKGDVLAVAQVAGIMAAKRTADIIPMCHNICLEGCDIEFLFLNDTQIEARATTVITAKTGVEMEAMVAVSATLLTIYDMAKAIDRGMSISDIRLEYKAGGKSGEFKRD